jgi:hypothetical protein
MAAPTLKTPSQIQQDYLIYLAGQKQGINTAQQDSDWWIRGAVVGGVVAGVYADNLMISNDAFPQRARAAALANWLQTIFGPDPVNGNFLPATSSNGYASVTGNPGQILSAGLQVVYAPNGNTYGVSVNTQLDPIAGTGLVPFTSIATGQSQNLLPFTVLNFPSPPAGLNSTAVVSASGFADATDPESVPAAASRVLTRMRNGITIGRKTDYEQYAKLASPSVVTALAVPHWNGPGTVGVYITSGTTDIDTALDNNLPISLLPSPQLIATVLNFLLVNYTVLTDDLSVLSPVEVPISVTGFVSYNSGTGATIPSNETLTQADLVIREIQRAIYKTPVGGRQIAGSGGFVFASDIEQTIDIALSDEPFETGGTDPILSDRGIYNLSATGRNISVAPNQIPVPGTIVLITV